MADLSQPNNPFDDHLSRLLPAEIEEPFYKSFIQTIKDLIHPPQLPPLVITSRPVAVKDIWGLYGRQKKSFIMSTSGQIALAVLVVVVMSTKPAQKVIANATSLILPADIPPDLAMAPKKQTSQGGGGGGDRSLTPASKGRLPKVAPSEFTPPSAVINNPNPKLAMDPQHTGASGRASAERQHESVRRPALEIRRRFERHRFGRRHRFGFGWRRRFR